MISRALMPLLGLVLTAACGAGNAPELDRLRGLAAVDQGRHDLARQYFAADFERHPDRVESLRDGAIAWTQGYQRSRSEARRLLTLYLERAPEDVDARQRLVVELLADADPEAARVAAALDRSPRSDLLRALTAEHHDPAAAESWLEEALGATPDVAGGWALGARLAEARGDHQLAAERARAALATQPFDYRSAYLLARVERRRGDAAAAARALALHEALAELEADGTRPRPAPEQELALLERVRDELGDRAVVLRLRLAQALLALGRRIDAEEVAATLVEDPEIDAVDLLRLATVADDAGARALTRRLVETALARSPGSPGAVASLAVLEWREGRPAKALELARGGLAAHPHFARLRYLEGVARRDLGDGEGAVASLGEAVRLAPWEWAWRGDLALALTAAGRQSEARQLIADAPESPPGWRAWRRAHPELGLAREGP